MLKFILFLLGIGFATIMSAHGVMGFFWFWDYHWIMLIAATLTTWFGLSFTALFTLALFRMIKRHGGDTWHKLLAAGFIAGVVLAYLHVVGVLGAGYGLLGAFFTLTWAYYLTIGTKGWDLKDEDFKFRP